MNYKDMCRCTGFAIFFAFTHSLWAAMPEPSKLSSRYGFTIEGMFARQTNSNLEYAYTANGTETSPLILKPTYYGAYKLSAQVALPDKCTNARFTWFHFYQSYSDSALGSPDLSIVPVYAPSTEFFDGYDFASGKISTRFDAFDLDVGQVFSLTQYLRLRLFTGVRYAHLSDTLSTTVSTSTPTGIEAAVSTSSNNSSFNGIGPLAGLSGTYDIGNHFSLVTNFDAALLVGSVNSKMTITNTPVVGESATGIVPNNSAYRVMPGFDGKVGLNFGKNVRSSQFNIEAGYQVSYYLDVIDRFNVTGVTSSTAAIFISSIQRKTSNFGLSGPYLSLNWNVV